MYKATKQNDNKYKILFIITAALFVLFIASFLFYAVLAKNTGDPDLKDFGSVFTYHFKSMGKLFIFQYGKNTNIATLGLSYLMYVIIVGWVIFLFVGFRTMINSGRRIVHIGLILSFLNIIKYMLFASGAEKYWDVINSNGAFARHGELLIPVVLIIFLGICYALASIASYFVTIVIAYKQPEKEEFKDEVYGEIAKSDLETVVTNVLRRELQGLELAAQPEAVPAAAESAKVEEVKPEEQPAEEEAGETEEAKVRFKPYLTRLLTADKELQDNYNEIKNEIMFYGVKSRVYDTGELFYLNKKKYVMISIIGKMLKVYFALDPKNYKNSTIPVEDVSAKAHDTPTMLRVRSPLSVRRCKQLVDDVMEDDGLEQDIGEDVDWVSRFKEKSDK